MSKLKKDGFGAAIDAQYLKGFVPIHSAYLNAVASSLSRQKKNLKVSFDFSQRSRWNLKFDQDLKDSFEKEGWDFLESEQSDFVKAGAPLKNLRWQPYIQIDEKNGKKVLRYLSAEPAHSSCIECHNKWEQLDEVKTLRKMQGTPEGKSFTEDELMGVLSVTVPLDDE